MIKKILFVFSYFLFSNYMIASGGSVYTRYGLGDLYLTNSSLELAMGGLGTSLLTIKNVNTNNPATIFNIKNTRFGASVNANISHIDDGLDNALYSNVHFSGFHIAFPIKESIGMSFLLGMKPFSTVNYEVVSKDKVIDTDTFDENFTGLGGISKLFFGISYLLPYDFAIGATFDYYTGNIEYTSSRLFKGGSNLTNSVFISDFSYRGIGTTLGLESPNFAKILDLDFFDEIRFGIAYEISGNINTDTSLIGVTSLGDNIFESNEVFTKIPEKMSIGLNLLLNEKYLIVLDYLYQPWSKYEQNGLKSNNLGDLSRYSAGIQFGDQKDRFATFWEQILYRGGLSFEQSQYQFDGKAINQIGFHVGLSFPLGLENSIDIGIMYGIRGTKDLNLLKENIFQTSISLNFGELWFIRREL